MTNRTGTMVDANSGLVFGVRAQFPSPALPERFELCPVNPLQPLQGFAGCVGWFLKGDTVKVAARPKTSSPKS